MYAAKHMPVSEKSQQGSDGSFRYAGELPEGRWLPALLPGSQLGRADKADARQRLGCADVAALEQVLAHAGHAFLGHHVCCEGGRVQPVVSCEAGVAPLCMRHAPCAVRLLHSILHYVKQMVAQPSSDSQREGHLHQVYHQWQAQVLFIK